MGDLAATHEQARSVLTDDVLREVIRLVPDEWLGMSEVLTSTDSVRASYLERLATRRDRPDAWLPRGER